MPDPHTTTTLTTAALPPGPGAWTKEDDLTRQIADLNWLCDFRDDEIARQQHEIDNLRSKLTSDDSKARDADARLARAEANEGKAKAMYATGDELFGHIEGGFALYHDGRACEELAAFRDALVAWSLAQPVATPPSPAGDRAEGEEKTRVDREIRERNDDLAARLHEANQTIGDLRDELAQANADVVAKHNAGNKIIANLHARLAAVAERERRLMETGRRLKASLDAWGFESDSLVKFAAALAAYASPTPAEAKPVPRLNVNGRLLSPPDLKWYGRFLAAAEKLADRWSPTGVARIDGITTELRDLADVLKEGRETDAKPAPAEDQS